MPAVNTIIISDGAATPVAHTFSPQGQDAKGVWWFEQTTPSPANPLGAKRISVSLRRSLTNGPSLNTKAKVVIGLWVPTLETVGNTSGGFPPPPTLSYSQDVRIEFTLPERGTEQERKDTRTLCRNLMGDVQIVNCVEKLLAMY